MHATSPLAVPAGGASRLFVVPRVGYVVVIAADPERVTLDSIRSSGPVSLFLTHDLGFDWPDARGEALGAAALAAGGVLALGFASYADALSARRRLESGAA